MKIVLLWLVLVISIPCFSQLDPFYFGTYMNNTQTISYTVYTMDEVVDDCFIVEKDLWKDGISIKHWNGYGHCNGDDGRMELFLDNAGIKIPIEFNLLSNGIRTLTIYPSDKNSEVYIEKNE
jgi:hypothetical protein